MKSLLIMSITLFSLNTFATTINCMDKALVENPDSYGSKAFTVLNIDTKAKIMNVIHVPDNSTFENTIKNGHSKIFPIVKIKYDENGTPYFFQGHIEGKEGAQLALSIEREGSFIGELQLFNYQTQKSKLVKVLCKFPYVPGID